MKIRLNKCADLGDWYTLVRAEHDGKEWFERVSSNCQRFMTSERLSPEACIEGSASDMLEIAAAITTRGSASFKRVSVHFEPDGAHLHSPKNSERDVVVTVEVADDLAKQIFAELANTKV